MFEMSSQLRIGQRSPQLAYALASLLGGAALFILQFITVPPPFSILARFWMCYGILGFLFGLIWPDEAWQWGAWLSLPLCLMAGTGMAIYGLGVLSGFLPQLIEAVSFACLGSYVGANISPRNTNNVFAAAQKRRKRAIKHSESKSLIVTRPALTATPSDHTASEEQPPFTRKGDMRAILLKA